MNPEATCKRFYILLQGRVKVIRQNADTGRELTLFLLGPGDGFNVISLLDGKRHNVIAETLDPVIAVSAPISLWHDWLDRYPSLRDAMRRYIDQQMRRLSELAADLALHDTMARLAHLILRNYEASQANPGRNLLRGLSHEELAHLIGTVRVVVNRLLRELREEGVIKYQNGEIKVLDLQKLLRRAEQALGPPDRKNILK
jgi:CRP-like cAMP-binding protein